jgi:signal transduction histidine kinase
MSSTEKSIGQAKGRGRALGAPVVRARRGALKTARPSSSDSSDRFARFSKRYLMALQNYLLHPEEVFLQLAYDLGRQAVAEGIGLLNVLRIHSGAAERTGASDTEKRAAAETFLMEALSPFEATHRGFRETNDKLAELNATLAKRNNELAAINFALKQEIEERKRTEEALRQSKEHYRVLFNDARVMQENLRHLSNRVLSIQEEERKRISRELHDEVGQALTAVNVHLTMVRKCSEVRGQKPAVGDQITAAEQIAEAQKLVEQTMEAVHRFARELRPAMLDDLGLGAALRSYINAFSERTGLPVKFEAEAVIEQLGSDEKMVLYRVAQEGLTNVARHAEATQAEVIIRATRVALRLEIRDNGKAFSLERAESEESGSAPCPTRRLGLLGMQERVRLVNGTFHIDSHEGKGTVLRVDLPLPRQRPVSTEKRMP